MYIAFEGIEGSGKSLQVKLLIEHFKNRYKYIATKEPGSTKIGTEIRKILLNSDNKDISKFAELFLYFADRAQHYREIIFPNYNKCIIISDRSMYSTFAYQGYGRGIDFEILNYLNDLATNKIYPDEVILLDCPVEEGLKRAFIREGDLKNARFELESEEFHRRVRKGYLEMAKKYNWKVFSALEDPEKLNKKILNYLFEKYEGVFKNFIK